MISHIGIYNFLDHHTDTVSWLITHEYGSPQAFLNDVMRTRLLAKTTRNKKPGRLNLPPSGDLVLGDFMAGLFLVGRNHDQATIKDLQSLMDVVMDDLAIQLTNLLVGMLSAPR